MKRLLIPALSLIGLFSGNTFAQTTQDQNIKMPLSCEYLITNEWNTGFTGVVQLTNDSDQEVIGWELQWLLNKNSLNNTWNADFETVELEGGSHLYIAKNLAWNESIKPEQMIEFGFQGELNDSDLELATVNGTKCKDSSLESDSEKTGE